MALSRLSRGDTRYTLLHLIESCEPNRRLTKPSILALALLLVLGEHIILISWGISERLRRGSFLHAGISSRFSEGRNKASHSSHKDSIQGNTTEDQHHSSFN